MELGPLRRLHAAVLQHVKPALRLGRRAVLRQIACEQLIAGLVGGFRVARLDHNEPAWDGIDLAASLFGSLDATARLIGDAQMHAGHHDDVGERRQRGVPQMLLQIGLASLRRVEAQRQDPAALPDAERSLTRQMPRDVSRKNIGGTRCVHGVGLFSRLR